MYIQQCNELSIFPIRISRSTCQAKDSLEHTGFRSVYELEMAHLRCDFAIKRFDANMQGRVDLYKSSCSEYTAIRFLLMLS